jgi:hypothetical protein
VRAAVGASFAAQVLQVAVGVALGATAYLAVAWRMRIHEVSVLARYLPGALRRRPS